MAMHEGGAVRRDEKGYWTVWLEEMSTDRRPRVYVSDTSDFSGAGRPAAVEWQAQGFRVAGAGPTVRTYLHLQYPGGHVKTVAERVIPLEGGFNFRDLGGYPSTGGRRVRWGKLFRSGRLSLLTPTDQELIRSLQLQAICDLRSAVETTQDPTPEGLAKTVHAMPLKLSTTTPAPMVPRPGEAAAGALAQSMMQDSYQAFAQSVDAFREFFQLLLDVGPSPVLFHCTAGKDRTGVTAALLLWALDVPWHIIVQDFLLSNQFTDQFIQLLDGGIQELDDTHPLWPFVRVETRDLDAAVRTITGEFGSLEHFFTKTLGLPPTWQDTLQNFYLES